MKTKQGFTLIELLVVVLIIGILAAVALPQYQKAVLKSRLAEVKLVFNTLEKSLALCALEKGDPFECEKDLLTNGLLQLPGTTMCSNQDCIKSDYWTYTILSGSTGELYAQHEGDEYRISKTVRVSQELTPESSTYCEWTQPPEKGGCTPVCGMEDRCIIQ